MKLFSCKQTKEIDKYTVMNEPVTSLELMERASVQLFKWCIDHFDRTLRIMIFTGPGNNGGDGLALGRMLAEHGYRTEVYHVCFTAKNTEEWEVNRRRYENSTNASFFLINSPEDFPVVTSGDVIVDAIFGSGLSRPAEGMPAEVIKLINRTVKKTVMAVDIPSGLFGEDNRTNNKETIIKADHTLTLQFPKLSFFFPENHSYTGKWHILPIGLHPDAINKTSTPFTLLEYSDILYRLKSRSKFDHKGIYGHGLLIAGSHGKIGAAVLSAKAALRTGIGLLTCHVPGCGYQILQICVNEAMVRADKSDNFITDLSSADSFTAYGLGPGIGTVKETQEAFHSFLIKNGKPLVVDADALNILSYRKEWLSLLTPGTVITPHPGEFERIAGETSDGYSRLIKQIEFSERFNCYVVLKGAFTSVATPAGKVFFNSTGNPGMATAGSGDVLTGIILSLLAQGYTPEDSSVCGVFLHGLAGDLAAEVNGYEAVIASDIIDMIGKAYTLLRKQILK
jgi:NAD(P)H-hydrate epimerase